MKKHGIKSASGFTLIEMMIVVAIIGILAAVATVQVAQLKAKARNSLRESDLDNLRAALNMYYTDHGEFPSTGSSGGSVVYFDSLNYPDWIPGLVPTYISALPKDPLGGVSTLSPCVPSQIVRQYRYASDGNSYMAMNYCGPEGDWSATAPFYSPTRPTSAWYICEGQPSCNY